MKKISLSLALVAGLVFTQAQKAPSEEELALQNWYHTNYAIDSVYGVADDATYAYAKEKGLKSSPITVAVIDSGIQGDHEDLSENMWVNIDEIPGNGVDDDNNGYVDDIHGWNFIGGATGDVNHDNLEITRLVREGKQLFETVDEFTNKTNREKYPEKYTQYVEILPKFEKELKKNKFILEMIGSQIKEQRDAISDFATEYGADKKISIVGLNEFTPKSENATAFKTRFQEAINTEKASDIFGKTSNELIAEFDAEAKEATEYYQNQVDYYYNLEYDPREIVGDNYEDITEKYYGNNTIEGPDALHGTHVAGIIGAVRNNNIGMNGVAENVKIMSVRTVPDGDERDKDVANAIRYAVDNGAKIINMSFGKAYSPNKAEVWDALKYATDKGVLLVKAAGNDDVNIDEDTHYPSNFTDGGTRISNTLITVGASTRYNDKLKASFSNYGKEQVDIFAPGLEIYSTIPTNKYRFLQGTSMASPVVAGVAALVWSYFPNLSAQEIRSILISTGNYSQQLADISTNGVVIDALKAFKQAEILSSQKQSSQKSSKKERKRRKRRKATK